MFSDETATMVKVRFYRTAGGPPTYEVVDKTLDFGGNMTTLMADYDNEARIEIWPQVLEKAYCKFLGNGDIGKGRTVLNAGGVAGDAMVHLTGREVLSIATDDPSAADLANAVRIAVNANRLVTFSTGDRGNNILSKHHAYSAVSITPGGANVLVRDPTQPDDPAHFPYTSVPLLELSKYFVYVFIQ